MVDVAFTTSVPWLTDLPMHSSSSCPESIRPSCFIFVDFPVKWKPDNSWYRVYSDSALPFGYIPMLLEIRMKFGVPWSDRVYSDPAFLFGYILMMPDIWMKFAALGAPSPVNSKSWFYTSIWVYSYITWDRRWVASLLADEQAVRSLLKYLMTTEVEGREGETERAAEWGQSVDQDGEELPDSR